MMPYDSRHERSTHTIQSCMWMYLTLKEIKINEQLENYLIPLIIAYYHDLSLRMIMTLKCLLWFLILITLSL